jgi:hypothetical protein
MAEFALLLGLAVLVGLAYLAYWIGVLLYRFFRWLIGPILEAIEHGRVLEEERQKEARLLEVHNSTREAIDQAVAHYVNLHEQAAAQSDRQPGPRRSD